MTYSIDLHVNGVCRYDASHSPLGGCACIWLGRHSRRTIYSWRLPAETPTIPRPDVQRAEITAIILALRSAWRIYLNLKTAPFIAVTIHTDSRYAVDCMTTWKDKWLKRGWMNARGQEVKNRDLIEEAYGWVERLEGEGEVGFVVVEKGEGMNVEAGGIVKEVLDGMEEEGL